MAKHIFKNVFLSLNAVTLSDMVKTVTLEYSSEIQDSTAHGSDSRTRLPGLKDWSITVEFFQNYDAAEVDASMWAIHAGTAAIAMILRPDAGVVGATNPQYTGNVVLESSQAAGGTVGDVHMAPVTFRGDGDLARATA
jgi:hypothetical protein